MAQNKTKKKRPRRRRPRGSNGSASDPQALANKVNSALALQRSGDLEQAKQLYCEVLSHDPSHADAWHLLGMTLYSAGAFAEAKNCLEKARQLVGDHTEVLNNLSLVHRALGDIEQAAAMLHQVISAEPENTGARNNLGVLLLEDGLVDGAEEQFLQILELDAETEHTEMNLANCWMKQNRLRDAERLYRAIVERDAENHDALGNLGECLRRQCKWQESLEVLELVKQHSPTDLVSRLTLARTLLTIGRLRDAEGQLSELASEHPRFAKAHHYWGTASLAMGNVAKAESLIKRSLEIDPKDAHAHSSLGLCYVESEQRSLATECFVNALKLEPKMSESHGCLLHLMCGDPSVSAQDLFAEHLRWGEAHGRVEKMGPHSNDRNPNRKLRIGYASGDFREHPVAIFFEPLLRLCDMANFETYCYSESGIQDDVTSKLKSMSNHWRETIGYSDRQVAQQIVDDRIDIMVDLAGHTTGNRLTALAYKPAPIQISWLGYPNTTGMDSIDYCLTCEVQNPIAEPSLHTEQLIRIPGGSFCYSPPENAPPISDLPAKRNGYVTFGSLHRPFKISPSTHDLWAAAMKACPNARLLAFHTRFNDRLKKELVDALVHRGVEAERIEIRQDFSGDSYLEIYQEIDIGLDATPWAGGTTTMGALWMGVPVIGHYGNNRPSRGTAGIVHHLGKPDWIASDVHDYSSKVSRLAGDIDELERLRGALREMTRTTIADEQRFMTELEKAYRSAWQHWCMES